MPARPDHRTQAPAITSSAPQIRSAAEVFGVKQPIERPDRRSGEPPLMTAGPSPSRGPIQQRRRISSEEALAARLAVTAAAGAAPQAADVAALQDRIEDQEAVIDELRASNAALAARLDALDAQGDDT